MATEKGTIIDIVNLEELHLDNETNPRLPSWLEGADDTKILDYMVLESNVLELMIAIGEKDYFKGEPLLVVPAQENSGYRVVEGNRRLSAVMLLHNPSSATVKKESLHRVSKEAKNKPSKLPIIVFDSRNDILDYLGYRHITGIKEWDSLAKAKYLRQLHERSKEEDTNKKCSELARIIGSRADYVRKLLCALSVHDTIQDNGYFGIAGLDKSISFSLITTALAYTTIQEFLGLESGEDIKPEQLNLGCLEELTKWMFDRTEGKTRLGESRNLSQLASVVADQSALNEFRDGKTLETAFLLSEGAKQMVVNAIWSANEKLDLAYKYSTDITLDSGELKQLDHISKTALAIKKLTTPDQNG